ncbi:MAG: glycosyltransferase [Deltaproteobacteria bacterium]|jgi:GT2 family glycosyltransferase|nr:glycosyltransferase [Deltaproteobacteria bacterium]MBW2532278.1 glycosyltransferase [Deltaproteobacteria bacterium]
MAKPPKPPSERTPPSGRKLEISPHVTVQWVGGVVRVTPKGGSAIETRDAAMLWLLHEFATPRHPDQVADSLPGTSPSTLETAIADLRAAGILVPAISPAPPSRSATSRTLRRGSIPGEGGKALTASVVIPLEGDPRYLDYTLASFQGQTDERFEILIVDGTDSPRAERILRHYRGRLVIQHLKEAHRAPASARNIGLAHAAGDIVIFSDDDRIVAPTFVERHLGAYRKRTDQRMVLGWMSGVLSVVERSLLGPMYPVLRQKLQTGPRTDGDTVALFEPADLAECFDDTIAEFAAENPDWEPYAAPVLEQFGEDLKDFDVGWFLAHGGNLSAPRQAIADLGGFDEDVDEALVGADLAYGLCQAGSSPRIEPDAINYHQAHGQARRRSRKRASLRYFAKKHRQLEAQLFLWWQAGGIDPMRANRIARAAKRQQAAADPVVAALDSAMAEMLRLKLGW